MVGNRSLKRSVYLVVEGHQSSFNFGRLKRLTLNERGVRIHNGMNPLTLSKPRGDDKCHTTQLHW